VQRFLLRRGDTDDLAAIRDTILLWNRIRARIELERALDVQSGTERERDWVGLNMLLGKMKGMHELKARIDATVYGKGAARGRVENAEDEEGGDREGETEAEEEAMAIGVVSGSFKYTIKPGCVFCASDRVFNADISLVGSLRSLKRSTSGSRLCTGRATRSRHVCSAVMVCLVLSLLLSF